MQPMPKLAMSGLKPPTYVVTVQKNSNFNVPDQKSNNNVGECAHQVQAERLRAVQQGLAHHVVPVGL